MMSGRMLLLLALFVLKKAIPTPILGAVFVVNAH
jgi:hypothetical protein